MKETIAENRYLRWATKKEHDERPITRFPPTEIISQMRVPGMTINLYKVREEAKYTFGKDTQIIPEGTVVGMVDFRPFGAEYQAYLRNHTLAVGMQSFEEIFSTFDLIQADHPDLSMPTYLMGCTNARMAGIAERVGFSTLSVNKKRDHYHVAGKTDFIRETFTQVQQRFLNEAGENILYKRAKRESSTVEEKRRQQLIKTTIAELTSQFEGRSQHDDRVITTMKASTCGASALMSGLSLAQGDTVGAVVTGIISVGSGALGFARSRRRH